MGISLDGDGDRLIMSDEKGGLVNGDHILAVCATNLAEQKKLPGNTIVATHMSNFGLNQAMEKIGVKVIRADVGDKYVVNEMRKNGYILGGEQSGHIIFLEHATTGDGIIGALSVLAVMKRTGKQLSELHALMQDVPQVLINTRVGVKKPLESINGYETYIKKIEEKLNGNGRIFVRFSGTEPVVRVLVEGPDKIAITKYAEEVADFLQKHLAE